MAMTEEQTDALAERIAKVFLFNQLCDAYMNCAGSPEFRKKIGDDMVKLRDELWP